MAAKNESALVLRTVYLPKELDDELRQLAFSRGSSKNALIREAIKTAFETWKAPSSKPVPRAKSRHAMAGG